MKQRLGGFAFRYPAACAAAQTFDPPARTVLGTKLSWPDSPPLLHRMSVQEFVNKKLGRTAHVDAPT